MVCADESTRAVIAALKVGGFVMSFKPEAQPGTVSAAARHVVMRLVAATLALIYTQPMQFGRL